MSPFNACRISEKNSKKRPNRATSFFPIIRILSSSVTWVQSAPPCLDVDLKVIDLDWRRDWCSCTSKETGYSWFKFLELTGVWGDSNDNKDEPELYEQIPIVLHYSSQIYRIAPPLLQCRRFLLALDVCIHSAHPLSTRTWAYDINWHPRFSWQSHDCFICGHEKAHFSARFRENRAQFEFAGIWIENWSRRFDGDRKSVV